MDEEANLPCLQNEDLRPSAHFQLGDYEPALATGSHGANGAPTSRAPAQFATGSTHFATSQPARGESADGGGYGDGGTTFESGLGGATPYGARRLRSRGRAAKESGCYPTDYTTSPTFVPFYAQRLSMACVLNGASAIQKTLKRAAARRLVTAAA